MSNIEELVRQSLRQRAEDVEATPALWQEVDRRIARRRRLQLAVWSAAGATAVVLGALVLPSIIAAPDPTPEVEPMPPGPVEAPDIDSPDTDTPVEDPAPGDPAEVEAPTDDTDDGPVGDADTGTQLAPDHAEPLLVANVRSIDLIDEGGRVSVLEMDAEGESWIMGLAVRPGSTADDYTAAVLTTAEGFWDLRHLHVVDGKVATWEVFPEPQHRPHLSQTAIMGASVSGPVFSPDGDALAWTESVPDSDTPTLRIIGWADDGPGTGAPATDNTEFSLDVGVSADGRTPVVQEWIWSDGQSGPRAAIVATMDEPTAAAWYIPLERQADGAWSMPADGPVGGIGTDVGISESGAAYAVAGTMDDGSPRWKVRLESGGLALYHDPFGEDVGRVTTRAALPDDLLPGEGFPVLWVHDLRERVAIVGSANTAVAYLVDPDGNVGRVEGEVAWAGVIR